MPMRKIKSNLRQSLIRKDKALRAEATKALEQTGKELKQQHEAVVRRWKHKPRFQIGIVVKPDVLAVTVAPNPSNKKTFLIWLRVDEGTKPHVIRAKRGKYLRFQSGYSARTAPPAQFNRGSGKKFGGWVQKQQVNHPGTAARGFTVTFAKKIRPKFVRRIEQAFRRAMRR